MGFLPLELAEVTYRMAVTRRSFRTDGPSRRLGSKALYDFPLRKSGAQMLANSLEVLQIGILRGSNVSR
jgi:hypothetical protein